MRAALPCMIGWGTFLTILLVVVVYAISPETVRNQY